jgi:hypothetical protein
MHFSLGQISDTSSERSFSVYAWIGSESLILGSDDRFDKMLGDLFVANIVSIFFK